MANLIHKIQVDENHLEQISTEFKKCSSCVGEIITETKNMKKIMDESYKGRASTGLNDYFTVLNQHMDVLKLCYKQLADYTNMVKEISLLVDKNIGNSFYKGGTFK